MRLSVVFTIFLLLLVGCTGRSRNDRAVFDFPYNTLEEAEVELVELLDSVYHHPDSFKYWTYDEVVDFILKEPRTMDYSFDLLKKYIDVVTSEDGNLRFYYWDDRMGGTMTSWTDICQFRYDGKVRSCLRSVMDVKYGESADEAEWMNNCAVLDIKTIYDSDSEPVYLVLCYIRESSTWMYISVEAVQIKDGKLVGAPVFYGEIEEEEEADRCFRGTEYCIAGMISRTNDGERWDGHLIYDDQTGTLYVPQADPELTDRYSLYRFDGKNFNFAGSDGGYWLHPSLRSFECLEQVFDTEKYRVRIDRMSDGTYRYASWRGNGPMIKEPDIILAGGSYDDDGYHFSNNGYEYLVDKDLCLSVRHNGRTVLRQKRKFSES